jgi:hypothetical protein
MKYLKVNDDNTTIYPYELENLYKDFPWEFDLGFCMDKLEEYGIFALDPASMEHLKKQSCKIVEMMFDHKIYGSIDTPYGDISLDRDNQLDLYRGAIGARHAGDNKVWSHPVKLKDGNLVELSAPLMLFIYDTINEYINDLQRKCDQWHTKIKAAETKEDLLTIYNLARY